MTYTVTPEQLHAAEFALNNALCEGASLTSAVHAVLGAVDTPTATLEITGGPLVETLIDIAFTRYPRGSEQTYWKRLPAVPAEGHTVHLQLSDDPDDSIALTVFNVSWVSNTDYPDLPQPGWHVEIGLRG